MMDSRKSSYRESRWALIFRPFMFAGVFAGVLLLAATPRASAIFVYGSWDDRCGATCTHLPSWNSQPVQGGTISGGLLPCNCSAVFTEIQAYDFCQTYTTTGFSGFSACECGILQVTGCFTYTFEVPPKRRVSAYEITYRADLVRQGVVVCGSEECPAGVSAVLAKDSTHVVVMRYCGEECP